MEFLSLGLGAEAPKMTLEAAFSTVVRWVCGLRARAVTVEARKPTPGWIRRKNSARFSISVVVFFVLKFSALVAFLLVVSADVFVVLNCCSYSCCGCAPHALSFFYQ
jgi:hypothetical protein